MNEKFYYKTVLSFLFVSLLFLCPGCNSLSNNPSGPNEGIPNPNQTGLSRGIAGPVSFSIRLPENASEELKEPSKFHAAIRASSETAATVTYKLVLINTGDSTSATTTFVKTVPVNVTDGTAEVSFTSIPAGTCIGELQISGGNISSYSDFHGMTDLVPEIANTIIIVPKNTGLLEDLMVQIVQKGLLDPATFKNAPMDLTNWLKLLMTRFDLESTSLIDDALAAMKDSFTTGFPLLTRTESVNVSLPPGSTLATSTLKVISAFSEGSLNEDGSTNIQQLQELAQNTASLLICENDSGNAVLMKMIFDSNDSSSIPVSVESTAEALIMIDPYFSSLSTNQISQARLALKQHANYPKLLEEIQKAIIAKPADPFDPETQDALYEQIAIISKDVFTSILPPASMRFATTSSFSGPIFSVGADGEQVSNGSYCNYTGEIKKNKLLWKDIYLNRTSLFGGFWASPQVCFDNKVLDWIFSNSPFNPGPGDGFLELSFSKDAGLTLADGIIGLVLSCAGVAKPSLNADVRLLANALGNTWKTVKGTFTSNTPAAAAGNFIKTILASKEIMRRITIIVFRAAAKGSWVRTVLRATMKKMLFWVNVGEITYQSTELALIVKSTLLDPSAISESAYLRDGIYPVGSISSIILKNGPEKLEAGQTLDLKGIDVDINYDKVERVVETANDEIVKETIADAVVRTHTTASPAFPNGISQIEWTGDNLKGTIFTAPVDAGNYKLTCKYLEGIDNKVEMVADLTINVMGITSLSFPAQKKLLVGEQLDLSAIVVTANYSDGTSKTVTATWSGSYVAGSTFTASAKGTYKVTCTYSENAGDSTIEKTAELSLTVVELNGITLSPTTYSTYAGQTFDLTKAGVTANYSDGTSEEISDQNLISWSKVSGPGTVSGKIYSAPASIDVASINDVLKCTFSRSGASAEANMTITVAQGRFVKVLGVVTDNLTGLQWMTKSYTSGNYKTWYEFRDIAATETFADGGWRIPSLGEAQSVIPEGYEAGHFMAPGYSDVSGYILTNEERYSQEPISSLYDPTSEPTHQIKALLSGRAGFEYWRYASTPVAYTFFVRGK